MLFLPLYLCFTTEHSIWLQWHGKPICTTTEKLFSLLLNDRSEKQVDAYKLIEKLPKCALIKSLRFCREKYVQEDTVTFRI